MPSEKTVRRVAERLAKALVEGKLVVAKKNVGDIETRVFDALRADFREEAAIEREAERILEENRRQMAGMDQRTMLLKIKQKVASDRGFVL
jgi:hypothetical protein